MALPANVITYDVGTTGVKTCLYRVSEQITLAASCYTGYGLYILENGGAEQDPDEWWAALCSTTKDVLAKAGVAKEDVTAVSFCSQMQCLVLVDAAGRPVRRAMSYMDNRAQDIYGRGPSIPQLLTWLRLTRAAPTSAKDPLWKYLWVKQNEPERFARVHKWLDAKDYLSARFTGRFTMTRGNAYATFLYDVRPGRMGWSDTLCRMGGVNPAHLPEIIDSHAPVGSTTAQAAGELGLMPGTTVYGGGGDAELIGVGVGAVARGDTHIYLGTSGWVSTVTERQVVDVGASIASIVGPQPGLFHYFAEMETAGKCLEWVKNHLALDEIGIFLDAREVTQTKESVYLSLYDYLCDTISRVPAGSGGVVFAPWLHGNRCPFEDPNARGIFFNIGLETGKSALIRSVIEGVAFHCRLMLEAQQRKMKTSETILLCGGLANAPVVCQIFADVLGCKIATLPDPQNAGAYGAAILIAVALGSISSIKSARQMLPEYEVYHPDPSTKAVYDKNYRVFQNLHKNNKKAFAALNR